MGRVPNNCSQEIALDKLRYLVRAKTYKFKEIWDAFMQLLESNQAEMNE